MTSPAPEYSLLIKADLSPRYTPSPNIQVSMVESRTNTFTVSIMDRSKVTPAEWDALDELCRSNEIALVPRRIRSGLIIPKNPPHRPA